MQDSGYLRDSECSIRFCLTERAVQQSPRRDYSFGLIVPMKN